MALPAVTMDVGSHDPRVSGILTLGGTLQINLINGFVPSLGQEFEVLTYGTVTGGFSSFDGQDLGGGLELQSSLGDNGLTLKVVASL